MASEPNVIMLDPKKIAPPRDYIRLGGVKKSGLKEDIAAEYTEAMKAYGGWGTFPPAEVIALPKADEKGRTHESVDGEHRRFAAMRNGIAKIPCIVQPLARDGDLYLRQAEANRHGFRLDKKERDNAARRLVEHYGFERKKVQDIFGLSKSSVDRMVKGTQIKEGPRKKPKKGAKPKAKKVAAQMPPKDAKCSAPDFLNACKILVRAFVGNRDAIVAEYRKAPKPWEVTLTGLNGISQVFAKAGG